MIVMSGLTVRESDGVLLWNGVPIEARNVLWDGMPVVCVAARLDPIFGPTWQCDHATGELAEKIKALGSIDSRLETMWSLRRKKGGEHDSDQPDRQVDG
jgi:hypothetical protein